MKIVKLSEATSLPEFREYSAEEVKEALALAKAAFTAEDLQEYTEPENGVPYDEFLIELEQIQEQFDRGQE